MSDEQTSFIEDSEPVDSDSTLVDSPDSLSDAPLTDSAPGPESRMFPTSDTPSEEGSGAGTDATPAPSLKDILKARGFEVPEDADDSALEQQLRAMQEQSRHFPTLQAYARKYYEIANDQRYQAYLQSLQQGGDQSQVQQPKVAAPVERPQRPEFDPEWMNLVRRDENGILVPISSGVDPSLPQKIEAYRKYAAAQQQKWIDRDPEEFEQQVFTKAQEYVEQKLQEFHQNMVQNSLVNQTIQANASWAHLKDDKTGQVILNPITHAPELTPAGNLYVQAVETLAKEGVKNVQVQDLLAKYIVRGAMGAPQPQTAPPAPIAPTKREQQQTLRQAVTGRAPNRSGTFTASQGPNDMPQNGTQNFLEMAMAEARRRGVVPSTT